jgi:hypothetical protein
VILFVFPLAYRFLVCTIQRSASMAEETPAKRFGKLVRRLALSRGSRRRNSPSVLACTAPTWVT